MASSLPPKASDRSRERTHVFLGDLGELWVKLFLEPMMRANYRGRNIGPLN
jgi:hypothetical protein